MKEKLMKAAIDLFGKKGYSETSVQDIVDVLGVTKGTFYYYFDSKQQVLMDIQLHFIEGLLKQEHGILADECMDASEKIFEIVRMLVTNIDQQGAAARIFFREMRNLEQDQVVRVLKEQDQFRDNLQHLIENGIAEGRFRNDLPADIVTFAILGMCNWSYFWFDPNGTIPDQDVAVIYTELILNGMIQPGRHFQCSTKSN
ncbi:MAG TPA: TetR/AcrR family transcriptional regulator [Bacillales bacterium]|nr:TetR/AcrR family transcriptional regulator [Bacillales bacterium]